jgi:hypothetical protein
LDFGALNAKQCALLDQLLNIFRDGLPENKLHGYCCPPMPNIQYLPHIDNKMQFIRLALEQESDIPILIKMLASPRPDGRQRVIEMSFERECMACMPAIIRTVKEVKIPKNV